MPHTICLYYCLGGQIQIVYNKYFKHVISIQGRREYCTNAYKAHNTLEKRGKEGGKKKEVEKKEVEKRRQKTGGRKQEVEKRKHVLTSEVD